MQQLIRSFWHHSYDFFICIPNIIPTPTKKIWMGQFKVSCKRGEMCCCLPDFYSFAFKTRSERENSHLPGEKYGNFCSDDPTGFFTTPQKLAALTELHGFLRTICHFFAFPTPSCPAKIEYESILDAAKIWMTTGWR